MVWEFHVKPTLIVALILLLSGCAVISATVGVREPDLTRIQVGHTRDQVEEVFGKRLWRPGSADGLTYDIYQYERGRPSNPVLGAGLLLADFLTLGITELLASDTGRFVPGKQVAIAYDEHQRVRFVSQPWPVEGVDTCRRMRTVLPGDSGVPATARPSPMDRPAGAASELVILEVDSPIQATIDGRKPERSVFELPPGRHAVHYRATLGGSVMYGASVLSYDRSAEVELLPGRLYRLKHERHYGYPRSRADLFWIEDVHSGETLHCAWG